MATTDDDGRAVVREVELPAGADEVWDALTDADRVAAWFGADVAWELRPGGPARFVDDDGTCRDGEVDEVVAGRRLRFRWWPSDGGTGDGPGGGASAVTYELQPVPSGTRLVVTEAPLPRTPTAALRAGATAGPCAVSPWAATPSAPTPWAATPWAATPWAATAWDVRLVGLWVGCHAAVAVRA